MLFSQCHLICFSGFLNLPLVFNWFSLDYFSFVPPCFLACLYCFLVLSLVSSYLVLYSVLSGLFLGVSWLAFTVSLFCPQRCPVCTLVFPGLFSLIPCIVLSVVWFVPWCSWLGVTVSLFCTQCRLVCSLVFPGLLLEIYLFVPLCFQV
jgi:hypothetical protein